MKVRIKYSKSGAMKYIGHLDMLRYFQKLMRRADIPIAYSEGFNPHQKMSFGAPLGLGLTSEGEYCDIELTEPVSSKDAVNSLNLHTVDGVCIKSFKVLPDGAKNAMAAVDSSDYEITVDKSSYPYDSDYILKKFDEFFSSKEIIVLKKTKRAEKETDISPYIYDSNIGESDLEYIIYLNLSTGSGENIKPELVLDAFHKYIGFDLGERNIRAFAQINRIDAYSLINDRYVSLGEIGDDIQ